MPTNPYSLLILTSCAASLPAPSTDYNSLLSHSPSSAEAAFVAPSGPHASHASRSTNYTNSPSRHAHSSFTIILVSIGGVLGLVFLNLCIRRLIIHSRIPRQNTVLTDAERARIVQEIAECENASHRYWQGHSRNGSATGPPPPPYEHAPSYDLLAPERS